MNEYYSTYRPLFTEEPEEIARRSLIMAERAAESIKGANGTTKILDAGCGSGQFGRALKHVITRQGVSRNAYHLSGVELGSYVEAETYDACVTGSVDEVWPFDSASLDIVYSGAVLEHVFDFHFYLNETNRVLKTGGLFLIDVPNLGCIRDTLQILFRRQPSWLKEMQHVHAYTLNFLKTLLGHHFFKMRVAEADRFHGTGRFNPPRTIRRHLASWGACLCVTAEKMSDGLAVDSRLRHLYEGRYQMLNIRTVRLLPDDNVV